MNNSPPSLSSLVLNAARGIEDRMEGGLAGIGLSLAKYGVLSKLVEAGEPLPLGALADRCACVRSNMTQLIDRLEAEKLVERVDDPTDRRSVRATLTAAGRARHAEAAGILREIEREVLVRLDETDRLSLTRLVSLLEGKEL